MKMLYMVIGIMLLLLAAYIYIYKIHKTPVSLVTHPWNDKKFTFDIDELRSFSKKHNYFSKNPIIGKVSNKKEDLEITQAMLNVIHTQITEPTKRILATGELLTKVLAYRDLQENTVIKIPITTKYGKNILVDYKVDTVFDISKGMPAFGLSPLNHKAYAAPILLFRGTDFSPNTERGRASIISDLDLEGPGYNNYMKVAENFRSWIIKANKSYRHKTRVLGFSLGGALTSYTVIYDYDLVSSDPLQPCISFNSPGVIRKVYLKWKKIPDNKRPLYFNFRTENDLVSKYGHLLGYKYRMTPSKQFLPLHAHVNLMIAEREVKFKRYK